MKKFNVYTATIQSKFGVISIWYSNNKTHLQQYIESEKENGYQILSEVKKHPYKKTTDMSENWLACEFPY